MTIECYFPECQYHSAQFDPSDGPFCSETDCQLNQEIIQRFSIGKLLHEHIMRIVFTKSNGEERVLVGTTNPNLIPEDKMPRGIKTKQNNDVKRVFDLEKQEWRSFRWDSLKEAAINDNSTNS